tara:strand:- start:93 stop:344 length:252 start_codon:yes stop_codon:yes gene_type:complete
LPDFTENLDSKTYPDLPRGDCQGQKSFTVPARRHYEAVARVVTRMANGSILTTRMAACRSATRLKRSQDRAANPVKSAQLHGN